MHFSTLHLKTNNHILALHQNKKNIYSEVNIKKKKMDVPTPWRVIPNRACPLPYDRQ